MDFVTPISLGHLLLLEQICSPSAQDSASLGPRLRCPLPAVWEWECERRSHGDSSGVPFDRTGTPDSADYGRIQAEQSPAVRSEETHEGGDWKRPQEGQPQGGDGQNVANLCPNYTRWNRWLKKRDMQTFEKGRLICIITDVFSTVSNLNVYSRRILPYSVNCSQSPVDLWGKIH